MYRPPDYAKFWNVLDNILYPAKQLNHRVKYFLVLGDLNSDFSTVNGRKLEELCFNHSFNCLINEPTRITANKQSCLDKI